MTASPQTGPHGPSSPTAGLPSHQLHPRSRPGHYSPRSQKRRFDCPFLPDNGEQALDIAELLAKSGDVDLIVIDSVAALVPRAHCLAAGRRLPTGSARPPIKTGRFAWALRERRGIFLGLG